MSSIVVGDVHGCLEELDELLALLGPRRDHRLVFAGDLVDRGPDSVGVVRRVRELGADCVLGNHDEKHVRWARHEARRRADPSYVNPMRSFSPSRAAMNAALDEADHAFLASRPAFLELGDGWWVVHAGCLPRLPVARQKSAVLLRCRWLDERDKMIGQPDAPEGSRHWSDVWPGPERIVYGHHVHDLASPKRTEHTAGIDTGCCFGGRLTAIVLPEREIVQVAARREYAPLRLAATDD